MDEIEAYRDFMKLYDELCKKHELKLELKHMRSHGRDWYRLSVYEHKATYEGSDTVWVYLERIGRNILWRFAKDELLSAKERWENQ